MKKDKTTHIWLGKFESEKEFRAFFEESYSENEPINAFAQYQGHNFYDHDWIETYYNSKGTALTSFIDRTIPAIYSFLVEQIIEEKGITDANAIITYSDEWGTAKSKESNPRIWYLGEFNEQNLRALRPPLDPKALSIENAWWTEFPDNREELTALADQAQKRKDQLPALAKLALMYLGGISVERDVELGNKYLKKVLPYPELLHNCFLANGEAGYSEGWLQLYFLHSRDFEGSVSKEESLKWLDKAMALGSITAMDSLATMLMYSWIVPSVKVDLARAEKLLLTVQEKRSNRAYELFCLYNLSDEKIHNVTQAIHWLTISVNETGTGASFTRLAKLYEGKEGQTLDPIQMSKAIYLSCCQRTEVDLKYFKTALDGVTISDLLEGRKFAKIWITEYAAKAKHFKGELCAPFKDYLEERN